jgi:hypothetical protein
MTLRVALERDETGARILFKPFKLQASGFQFQVIHFGLVKFRDRT